MPQISTDYNEKKSEIRSLRLKLTCLTFLPLRTLVEFREKGPDPGNILSDFFILFGGVSVYLLISSSFNIDVGSVMNLIVLLYDSILIIPFSLFSIFFDGIRIILGINIHPSDLSKHIVVLFSLYVLKHYSNTIIRFQSVKINSQFEEKLGIQGASDFAKSLFFVSILQLLFFIFLSILLIWAFSDFDDPINISEISQIFLIFSVIFLFLLYDVFYILLHCFFLLRFYNIINGLKQKGISFINIKLSDSLSRNSISLAIGLFVFSFFYNMNFRNTYAASVVAAIFYIALWWFYRAMKVVKCIYLDSVERSDYREIDVNTDSARLSYSLTRPIITGFFFTLLNQTELTFINDA